MQDELPQTPVPPNESVRPINGIAAAYGQFIMNFTALESALETLLLNVAETRNVETYRRLHAFGLARKLKMLTDLVQSLPDDSTRASLETSCDRITQLATWRNERVHAFIDPNDWQKRDISHYHFHSRQRLSWDLAEIQAMTHEAFLIGQLGFWTAYQEVHASQEWKKVFDKSFDECFE
jgi:hypothetical protein